MAKLCKELSKLQDKSQDKKELAKKTQDKKKQRQLKIEMRANVVSKYLNDFIEKTRDVDRNEKLDQKDLANDEANAMMHVAASFTADAIEKSSSLGVDINIVYEDYLALLDTFLDQKEEEDK